LALFAPFVLFALLVLLLLFALLVLLLLFALFALFTLAALFVPFVPFALFLGFLSSTPPPPDSAVHDPGSSFPSDRPLLHHPLHCVPRGGWMGEGEGEPMFQSRLLIDMFSKSGPSPANRVCVPIGVFGFDAPTGGRNL
jgi:hypothetical protein